VDGGELAMKISTNIVDEHSEKVSLEEQLVEAVKAWQAVREALSYAWSITPQWALSGRVRIPRTHKNVSIAHDAIMEMMVACNKGINGIVTNRHARNEGMSWALESDEEAAKIWANSNR
jgi:hypothetical protein